MAGIALRCDAGQRRGFSMASPQKENGFTQIANEILEALTRAKLTGSQFAMIITIMRKTYGFGKKEDKISVSQFMDMMGLSRRAVIYNLQDLEAKAIISVKRVRTGELSDVNIIRLNKDYDTWVVQNSAPQVEKNRGSAKLRKKVVQNSVKSLPSFAPTKETLTKEITKETSKPFGLQAKQYTQLIDSFKPLNPMYAEFYKNTTERKALQDMATKWGYEKLLNTITALPEIVSKPYAPKITKPTELKRDLGKLLLFLKQEETKYKKTNNAIAEI